MTLIPVRRTVWPLTVLLASLVAGLHPPGAATAAELYRWVEADGSITFSPNRPPAGTEFTTIDTARSDAAATGATDAPVPSAESTPTPAEPIAAVTPLPNEASLTYAPPPLGAAIDAPDGISEGGVADAPPDASATSDDDGEAVSVAGTGDRKARCRELEKRVVSLERRLSTRLSAEDMDNTVLYMARYQQSVDRHCRG